MSGVLSGRFLWTNQLFPAKQTPAASWQFTSTLIYVSWQFAVSGDTVGLMSTKPRYPTMKKTSQLKNIAAHSNCSLQWNADTQFWELRRNSDLKVIRFRAPRLHNYDAWKWLGVCESHAKAE